MTFSQRVHESSVQFVEPVQTVSAVTDRVLVVHEVGNAGDRLRGHLEAVDQARLAAGRREDGRRLLAVEVEGEPDRDTSLLCFDDGAGDDRGSRLQEVEVVQRQVEALLSGVEESGEAVGNRERGLAAVRQRVHLDHEA